MSVDKNRAEAQRWLKTALDDWDTAVILKKNVEVCPLMFSCPASRGEGFEVNLVPG